MAATTKQDPSKPLANTKHEMFALSLSQGRSQAESADIAGYHGTQKYSRGSELAKKPEIAARVNYLMRKHEDLTVRSITLNKAWIIEKLKSNIEKAEKNGDCSSVNRACELLGKELGMFVERKVLGVRDLGSASADQLMDLLAELDGSLQAHDVKALPIPAQDTDTSTQSTE